MSAGTSGEEPNLDQEAIIHYTELASAHEQAIVLTGFDQIIGGFLWGHDPTEEKRLSVAEEAKRIYTNGHGIRWIWAVGFDGEEVAQTLRDEVNAGPMDVVHVMGMGDNNGVDIFVPCDKPKIAAPDFISALAAWSAPRRIELGIFNICYSRLAAVTAARRWGMAIGVEGLVHPDSAVFFAERFYWDLRAKGRNIRLAFDATIWAMKQKTFPIEKDADLYCLFPESKHA